MQGFNMGRYVPPDQEGLTTGNKLAGKHPLGARARHLQTKGALIVRFEMPFAVWCTTCKPHETLIGQGVRFNAEKKKIGNYYSTPIYSFRMKHGACGGWIEIRTDPKNTAYVVGEGGRKRDTGEEKGVREGEIAIRLGGEEPAVSQDPFARMEGKVEDKRRADTEKGRILELQRRQDRDWDDPYEMSRRLRKGFRAERKVLENKERGNEALKEKMSLGIELVDETEEDRVRASMVEFEGTGVGAGTRGTRHRPMFGPGATSSSASGTSSPVPGKKSGRKRPKAADLIAERKASFRSELTGNTRAVVDPFLSHDVSAWQPEVKKRKTTGKTAEVKGGRSDRVRELDSNDSQTAPDTSGIEENTDRIPDSTCVALVDYGSDSD